MQTALARAEEQLQEASTKASYRAKQKIREARGQTAVSQQGKLELLSMVPALKPLSEEERKVLARGMEAVSYEPSELIVTEGEAADCMWILQSGTAAADVQGHGVVMRYEPGE